MQLIAERLNISKVTVSKALNNQPGVSEALKKQILHIAADIGYQLPIERSLENLTRMAFLVHQRFNLENENFYSVIFFHLTQECTKLGISLQLVTFDNQSSPSKIAATLQSSTPDGVFLAGEVNNAILEAVLHTEIKLIGIDFYLPDIRIDFVNIDNYTAGYMATQHLIRIGHRTIGFVGNPRYSANVADRWFGYQKAMLENDLPIQAEWNLVNNDMQGVYFAQEPIPDGFPTAYICHCDMAAYHLIMGLSNQGYKIPQDVSILSFDNTELSRSTRPLLSSVNLEKAAFAKTALRQLLWRSKHPDAEPQRILLNSTLVERESIAPPQSGGSVMPPG